MRHSCATCVDPERPAPVLSLSATMKGILLFALFVFWPVALLHGQSPSAFYPAFVPDRILDRVDDSVLTTLPGTTHPALRNSIDSGPLAPASEMGDLVLVLTRSSAQQAALDAFNQAQNDPASPEYHHWLTPEEFGAAYGVSAGDLAAVTNWLQNHGFTIQEIPPSHTSIRFSGSSALVESAFHTQMHSVQSNGVAHIANMTDISIPSALTPVVAGVKALHNFFPKAQHHAAALPSQYSTGELGAQWTGSKAMATGSQTAAVNLNGLTGPKPEYSDSGYQLLVPYDMATIYNYKSLWSATTPIVGTGQTIAIAGTSNIVLSDVATFRAATGLPAKAPTVIVTNSDPGTTALLDDRFENTLDVEWSGGAAPGANIVLVTSSQTSADHRRPLRQRELHHQQQHRQDHERQLRRVRTMDGNRRQSGVSTTSGSRPTARASPSSSARGDSAAAVCDDGNYNSAADYAAEFGPSVSGMTSTPYNVSVGGTDFAPSSSAWSRHQQQYKYVQRHRLHPRSSLGRHRHQSACHQLLQQPIGRQLQRRAVGQLAVEE